MANCLVCHVSARSYQSRDDGLTFHRFPSSRAVICSRWKKFAGLAEDYDVKAKRLCSRHFRSDDFVNRSPFRKNLRCGAVPTLCRPSKYTPPKGSQTLLLSVPSLEDVLSGSEDPSMNDCTLDPALSEASESNDAFVHHVASASEEHDYITTAAFSESHPQELPEKNKDDAEANKYDTSSQILLDGVRKELCRLCGQKATVLAPIFVMPSLSGDVSMALKIEMYLPFKVRKEDPLPTRICLNCSDILNRWHELYVTCVAANAVLWKTFGGEFSEETSNDLDDTIISVKEEVEENEVDDYNEVEAEIEQQVSEPLIATEPEELSDLPCVEYEDNKTEMEITEEKTYDDNFDENFVTVRDYSYKCRFCFELFKNSEDRKNHTAMCRQLSTICEVCGHKILCRKDLRRHINLRHLKTVVNRIYFCDICDKCFKSQSGLKHHKIRHENPLPKIPPKYYCELCCTVFMHEKYFLVHQEKHAEGKIRPLFQIQSSRQGENSEDVENISIYFCPVCEAEFSDMLSLVVHLTTKKKMKCSLCRKALSCEKRYFLHVCGEWTCQYCPKVFKNKQKWIEHERIHTGEKPIKCRICDKAFRSWPARKLHENRHNPCVFQCCYCSKQFRNKYKFQDHVACHEGKKFLCDICNKNFSGRKNLWKHKRSFHKDAEETNC